jgi:hypothetical protein
MSKSKISASEIEIIDEQQNNDNVKLDDFFDDLNIPNNNNDTLIISNSNGKIRISNLQAQADYSVKKTAKKNCNGQEVFKKETTINDEKLGDTCLEIFQNSNISNLFNMDEIKQNAIIQTEKLFKQHNLIIKPENTLKENNLIKKKKNIAIVQYIKRQIEKKANKTYSVDYNKFIEMTGIKSAKRIGFALKLLDEIQERNFFEWNEEVLDQNLNIVHHLVKISIIPEIRLVLDEEVGSLKNEDGEYLYDSISSYRKAKIKNKAKHIKKITFRINPIYLSNILGLEKDYTEPNRKERNKFNSSYAFRLDTLLRSIEKVQNNPNIAFFSFQKIQKKFGTQYENYKNFKARVLVPAINDINLYTNINVTLKEERVAGEKSNLKYIRFIIERNNDKETDKRYGIDKVAFYIASRIFYFTNSQINSFMAFAKSIENQIKNTLDALTIYANKNLEVWKEESKKAYETEEKLLKLMEENKIFIDQHNLVYDYKRMTIVKKNDKEENDLKIKILKLNEKKITNPVESILYLNELLKTGYSERADIFDFCPFEIYSKNSTETHKINNMLDYQKFENTIIEYIKDKKLNYFKFENEDIADIFYKHIYRGTFRQLDNEVTSLIMKL